MRALLVCIVMAVCTCQVTSGDKQEIKLPPYVDICYRDDPKVAECIKKNVQKLMPRFKKGSADFDLEPLDPMFFDILRYNYKSPILGGDLVTTNSYLYGVMDSKVISVRPKLNIPYQFILDFDLQVPHMIVKAEYKLNGNVLNIPVNIKGRVDMHFENTNVSYHILGNTKTIEDYDYLEIEEFEWTFTGSGIKKMTVRNNDVVDGRPALNRMVKSVLNSSWRLIIDQMLPAVLPESNKKMKAMFAKAFKKYPYDVILPRRTRIQNLEAPRWEIQQNSTQQ